MLPQPVESYANEELVVRLRANLPVGIAVQISGTTECRTLHVAFSVEQVEGIAKKLSSRDGQLDWDWRGDLEPPRDGDAYEVEIDVAHDERPLLRVYSNDGNNREAWPLVFSMASSLAEDLDAIPEEDAPPPSDRIPLFIAPGRPKPS